MNRQILAAAVLLFISAAGSSAWYLSRAYPLDDAFITYSYARSVALGHGYRFTAFAPPVYGSTTPLYVYLLAALSKLGLQIPTASIALQTICWGIVPVFTLLILRRVTTDGVAIAAAAAVVMLHPAWESSAGMETALFTALLAAQVWSYQANRPWALAGFSGACALTRPEGYFIGLMFAIAAAVKWQRRAIGPLLLGVFIVLPWLLYAHFTFGSIVPNTVAAKIAYTLSPPPKADVIAAFAPFEYSVLTWILLALAIGGSLLSLRNRAVWPLAAIFAGGLLFYGLLPVPAFKWYWAPLLWLGYLLAIFGLTLAGKSLAIGLAVILVIAGAFSLVFVAPPAPWPSIPVAQWLADRAKKGDTIMTWCVGPYAWFMPQCDVIDMAGLCTPECIDVFRGRTAYTMIIKQRKPSWIIVEQANDQRPALVPSSGVEVYRLPYTRPGYSSVVYRQDWPLPERVLRRD